ncbi:hypothetical protein HDV06_002697 [Boothiomyces sp. JEL0866]|nr:hypothetical protein HDV06_002697 [Boothiomyces sp. JEL0866]
MLQISNIHILAFLGIAMIFSLTSLVLCVNKLLSPKLKKRNVKIMESLASILLFSHAATFVLYLAMGNLTVTNASYVLLILFCFAEIYPMYMKQRYFDALSKFQFYNYIFLLVILVLGLSIVSFVVSIFASDLDIASTIGNLTFYLNVFGLVIFDGLFLHFAFYHSVMLKNFIYDTHVLIQGKTRDSVAIGRKFTAKMKWMIFCSTAFIILIGVSSMVFQLGSLSGYFKISGPAINAMAISILHTYNLWVEMSMKGVMSVISEQSKREYSNKSSPNISYEIANSARVSLAFEMPSRKPSIIRKHSVVSTSNLKNPLFANSKEDDKFRQILPPKELEGNRSQSDSHKGSLNQSNKGSLNEIKPGSSKKVSISATSLHKSAKDIITHQDIESPVLLKKSLQPSDLPSSRRFSTKSVASYQKPVHQNEFSPRSSKIHRDSVVAPDAENVKESSSRKPSIRTMGSREISNNSSSRIEITISEENHSTGDLPSQRNSVSHVDGNQIDVPTRKVSIKSNHQRRFSNISSLEPDVELNPPAISRKVSFRRRGSDVLLEESEVGASKHERKSSKLVSNTSVFHDSLPEQNAIPKDE